MTEQEIKHSLFEITAKAVIVNDEGQVLILKRGKNSKFFPGRYDLPGGGVNDGEGIEAALMREIEEELGIQVEIGPVIKLTDFNTERNGRPVYVKGVRFLAFYRGGEVRLSDEHEEFEWMDSDRAMQLFQGEGYEEDKREAIKKAKEYLKLKNSLDGWKRCAADFENYKRRQADSQKDLIRYAAEGVIAQIIPVLDNFHMSTDHIPEDQKNNPWVVGIMHIQKQLETVLADNGVEDISLKIGDNFDTRYHEAMEDKECQECEAKKEFKNKIKKVVQRGYKMGEKVIRPARVIVE